MIIYILSTYLSSIFIKNLFCVTSPWKRNSIKIISTYYYRWISLSYSIWSYRYWLISLCPSSFLFFCSTSDCYSLTYYFSSFSCFSIRSYCNIVIRSSSVRVPISCLISYWYSQMIWIRFISYTNTSFSNRTLSKC